MSEQLPSLRRLPALVLAALSLVLLIHHVREFAAVVGEGAGHAALTLDFRTYMCGAANLSTPYDICHNGEAVSGFVYPPPSLLYFHLLSRLPIDTAFLIHSAFSAMVLAMAAVMAASLLALPRLPVAAATLGALAIAPVGTSLAAGQVNLLLMGAAVAGVWCAARGRPVAAGIAVALGFWLKIYPGFVGALFLVRRKWNAAVATIAASAVLAVLGLLWAAPQLYVQYFLELLPHVQRFTMPGVAQSLAGVAAHVAVGGGAPVQHFVPIPPAIQGASKLLLALGVLAAMAHQRATRDSLPLDSLGVLLAVSLVASPNSWGYHYALIFPVILAALARTLAAPSRWRTPLVLGCWLALAIPAWTDLPAPLAQWPWLNVPFRARYGIAALLLAGLTLWDARSALRALVPARQSEPKLRRR